MLNPMKRPSKSKMQTAEAKVKIVTNTGVSLSLILFQALNVSSGLLTFSSFRSDSFCTQNILLSSVLSFVFSAMFMVD